MDEPKSMTPTNSSLRPSELTPCLPSNLLIKEKEVTDSVTLITMSASIYYNPHEEPMNQTEIVAQSAIISALFDIDEVKAKYIAEIMAKDKWSLRRCHDAIEHVLKTNVYPQVMPGQILNFDRRIKLYTQEQVMMINGGAGTKNFSLVYVPFASRTIEICRTNYWYIRDEDKHLVPEWWYMAEDKARY